jgi:hypothetical protein
MLHRHSHHGVYLLAVSGGQMVFQKNQRLTAQHKMQHKLSMLHLMLQHDVQHGAPKIKA